MALHKLLRIPTADLVTSFYILTSDGFYFGHIFGIWEMITTSPVVNRYKLATSYLKLCKCTQLHIKILSRGI